MSDAKIPKEGEFDSGQLWFSRRGNVLTLGLTSAAIDRLGDLEEVTLPEEGDRFDVNDDIVTIDGTRGSVTINLPSKGLVVAVNPVASDLSVLAEDPLEEGWLVRYQVDDLEALAELGV